jgi:Protein of unknown function (DUF998)
MVVVVRVVPWWGVVSSAAAPVLLAGGWTVAARLQPRPVNPVASTISALAADGAADRWVMTLVLLAVGVCDVVTGLALRPAATPGRLILIAGGIAGVLVAANPEPARGGSLAHAFWATIGFIALTAWPLGGLRRGSSVPGGLRPAVSAVAAGASLGLLVWFAAELMTRGGQVGLAERVLTEAQAVWPLAVVLTCRRSMSSARLPHWARRGDLLHHSPWPGGIGEEAPGRRDVRPPGWSARSGPS